MCRRSLFLTHPVSSISKQGKVRRDCAPLLLRRNSYTPLSSHDQVKRPRLYSAGNRPWLPLTPSPTTLHFPNTPDGALLLQQSQVSDSLNKPCNLTWTQCCPDTKPPSHWCSESPLNVTLSTDRAWNALLHLVFFKYKCMFFLHTLFSLSLFFCCFLWVLCADHAVFIIYQCNNIQKSTNGLNWHYPHFLYTNDILLNYLCSRSIYFNIYFFKT